MSQSPGTSTPSEYPEPPPALAPRSLSRNLTLFLVLAGLFVVNSIGYLVYRSTKQSENDELRAESSTSAASAEDLSAAPPDPVPADHGADSPTPPGQDDAPGPDIPSGVDEKDTNGMIRAHRAIGLKAIEDGDFDLAVENLSAAVDQGGVGDIPRLLAMARDMQSRAKREPSAKSADPTLRGPESPEEQAKVKGCYRKYTVNQPNVDGKVKLHLVITPGGKVRSIGVEAPSIEGTEFRDCVVKLAKRWRFRKAVIQTKVVYPLQFIGSQSHGARGRTGR